MNPIFKILLASTAVGIFAAAPAAADPLRVEAIIVPKEGNPIRAWIIAANRERIRYHETAVTTAVQEFAVSESNSVFFLEPRLFSEALHQYHARDYRAALASFAKIAEDYQAVRMLPDNPSSRAAFYEMECLRQLGEYSRLSQRLGAFNRSGITREYELRQLELNLLWEAVGSEAWDRLEILVRQRADTRLPGYQRAQVAFCEALVHEKNDRQGQALNAYNVAMTADSGASEVLTRNSALAILRILQDDPEVKIARDLWGTPRERPNSAGYAKLLEAGAVARMFQAHLGSGAPLPAAFEDLIQYESKENPPS